MYELRRKRKEAESIGAKEKIQRGIGAILYVSLCDIFVVLFSDPLSYQIKFESCFSRFPAQNRRQWIVTCTRAFKQSLYTPHRSQFFFPCVSTVVGARASSRRRSILRSKDGSPFLFFLFSRLTSDRGIVFLSSDFNVIRDARNGSFFFFKYAQRER